MDPVGEKTRGFEGVEGAFYMFLDGLVVLGLVQKCSLAFGQLPGSCVSLSQWIHNKGLGGSNRKGL